MTPGLAGVSLAERRKSRAQSMVIVGWMPGESIIKEVVRAPAWGTQGKSEPETEMDEVT